jgi:hypothetical protein
MRFLCGQQDRCRHESPHCFSGHRGGTAAPIPGKQVAENLAVPPGGAKRRRAHQALAGLPAEPYTPSPRPMPACPRSTIRSAISTQPAFGGRLRASCARWARACTSTASHFNRRTILTEVHPPRSQTALRNQRHLRSNTREDRDPRVGYRAYPGPIEVPALRIWELTTFGAPISGWDTLKSLVYFRYGSVGNVDYGCFFPCAR